jgi:hypothetical protein
VRAHRGRIVLALAVAILAVAAWVPALIADHYADGPGGAEVGRARLDQGWEFLYHAVRLARGARLGTADGALEAARGAWGGPPAIATSVRLTYMDGPFEVPVPGGGTPPAPANRIAAPASPLGWVVSGSVRTGPQQVIGVLDYRSGRIVWDIRPLPDRVAE